MQVLVEIPDNKLNFALEVLRSLAFVKICCSPKMIQFLIRF